MDSESYILWSPEIGDHAYEIIEDTDQNEDDIIEDTSADHGNYGEVEILESENGQDEVDQEYYVGENIIEVPQETFVYYTDDGPVVASDSNNVQNVGVGMSHLIEQRVEEAENKIIGDQEEYTETVEEVITEEDWIQSQGEECVQVAMEQIVASDTLVEEENDTVPLQIDQDEYTSSRPYPCDFCSRRFRKKANLMNHMVAHQNDRPHACNLCGVRYIRRHDLQNHYKIHAYVPESEEGRRNNFGSSNIDFAEEFDQGAHNYAPKPTPSTSKKAQKIVYPSKQQKARKKITPRKPVHVPEPKKKPQPLEERFPITDARKPFVCQNCGVCFTRQKALESHSKLHENDVVYDCEICSDSFFDTQSLADHMKTRHKNLEASGSGRGYKDFSKSLPNDFEPDDSNSDYEPTKNQEEEDDDEDSTSYKDGMYFCDHCDFCFNTPEQLKRHIKTHVIKTEYISEADEADGEVSRHYCKVCGESFNEALDLLAHAEIHARFQPYRCELCGDSFDTEAKVKNHLYSTHMHQLTENSCRICGKHCLDQKNLIKHSWEHSREKSHPCSKCGKIFHNKARLKRHIASHKKKGVTCETCNEDFPDGRSLMNHRHSHTKGNQFPCYECGKTFGSRSSQQIHIRIHTGERPYGCRFCWKSFCDGGTLRKHERIHTGEKPYACLVCPRAFNQRVVLREHIRSHHSAADQKHGTADNPFYCTICGDLFPVSLDLIAHLIHHSDESTASKRVPIVGPRKYKRRRKLKPNEEPEASQGDDGVQEFLGFANQVSIKMETDKAPTIQDSSFTDPGNLLEPLTVPEEILEAPKSVAPAPKMIPVSSSGRPKMIHTQKTRVPVLDGKRKTKTLITKQIKQGDGQLKQPVERKTRIVKKEEKKDAADEIMNVKYVERFDSDIVHDLQEILRSPVKKKRTVEEETVEPKRRSARNLKKVEVEKEEEELYEEEKEPEEQMEEENEEEPEEEREEEEPPARENSDSDSDNENIRIKKEIIEENCCQICGQHFEQRSDLLTHVGIHI